MTVLKLRIPYKDQYKYRYIQKEYKGQLFCRQVPQKQKNYKQAPRTFCIANPPERDFTGRLPDSIASSPSSP